MQPPGKNPRIEERVSQVADLMTGIGRQRPGQEHREERKAGTWGDSEGEIQNTKSLSRNDGPGGCGGIYRASHSFWRLVHWYRLGYIEDIRALVGSRPLVVSGVSVLIRDRHDRILLHRRRDNGLWAVPGGCLEPGETFEQTARREAFEELNVTIEQLSLLGAYSGPDFYYHYANGDQVYYVGVAYLARQYVGNVVANPDEVLEVQFFEPTSLPRDLRPSALHVLSLLWPELAPHT